MMDDKVVIKKENRGLIGNVAERMAKRMPKQIKIRKRKNKIASKSLTFTKAPPPKGKKRKEEERSNGKNRQITNKKR